jgi:hypothetical protein
VPDDEQSDQPGWGAPHLPPREPSGGDAPPPEDVQTAPVASAPPPPSAAWTQPPPAAAPVAPGTTQPRRRRGWLIALVSVLCVIVLTGVLGTVFFVTATLPPFSAANDFVNDLAGAKFRSAASQLCAADQDNADRALSIVTRHFPGNDQVAVNPLTVDRDGSRATVEYTVSADLSNRDHTYKLPLREEHGDWLACPGDALR